jgi:AcrR family transcriptional regulator
MARQARSEATRQKIIDAAAVDLFDEIGYPTTGMGDIIECAQITKGARYHHFDSKESVAAAVIQIGGRCGMVARSRSRFSSGVRANSVERLHASGHITHAIGSFSLECAGTPTRTPWSCNGATDTRSGRRALSVV